MVLKIKLCDCLSEKLTLQYEEPLINKAIGPAKAVMLQTNTGGKMIISRDFIIY
jgi:hypothetical protein